MTKPDEKPADATGVEKAETKVKPPKAETKTPQPPDEPQPKPEPAKPVEPKPAEKVANETITIPAQPEPEPIAELTPAGSAYFAGHRRIPHQHMDGDPLGDIPLQSR